MEERKLPEYRSHKKVRALKIARIYRGHDGYAYFEPVEEGYADVKLDPQYVTKHDPQAGGYYVVYEDGYESWSPAEAFESGYSPVDNKEER